MRMFEIGQAQSAIVQHHIFFRRDEIDVVSFGNHLIFYALNFQTRTLRKQFDHETLIVRRQVLNDDVGQAGIGRQIGEKLL